MKRLIVFNIYLFASQALFANSIEKGFEALRVHNYFKARELFVKLQRTKNYSISSFGLATIYYRTDNPFHQLDSAYVQINRAKEGFAQLKPKSQEKIKPFVSEKAIDSLRQLISTAFYTKTLNEPSIKGLQNFIDSNNWSKEITTAVYKRDSLIYNQLQLDNSSSSYKDFLSKYPNSSFYEVVLNDYQLAQFQESTPNGTAGEFALFIEKFPENKFKDVAEDRLFQLVTKENTIQALEVFISTHPQNRNIDTAWERLYQLSVYDYTAENIEKFIAKYPDYPNLEKIQLDLSFIGFELLPFKNQSKFGFMDSNGRERISAIYNSVAPFKEGLALVSKNGKYGYINKNGEIVVDLIYSNGNDFEQGRAIVERFDRYGIIDRTGTVIIQPEFEDLGSISEGYVYGKKDSLYTYYNTSGKQIFPEIYTEAFSFQNGMAKVEIGGNQAYINNTGKYVIYPAFEEIEFFTDSLIIFGKGELYGLMKRNLQIVIPNKYDKIGKLSEGLALVVLDGKIGYINALGEEVIAPIYDEIPNYMARSTFKEGVAIVSKNGQVGIINSKGKEVVPFKNENIGDWSDLIAVKRKNRWGYINRANVVVIPITYDFAESFKGDLAIVQEYSLSGVIDKSGKKVLETGYNMVEILNNQFIIANNGALFGLFDRTGKEILPMVYTSITNYNEDLLMLQNSESIKFFLTKENKLIDFNMDVDDDSISTDENASE